MASEIVPLTVTTSVIGVAFAAATFMACFTLHIDPTVAGIGMVVAAVAAAVAWSKWRAWTANRATAVLAAEFRRLRDELGG
jgi:hypothetical protein